MRIRVRGSTARSPPTCLDQDPIDHEGLRVAPWLHLLWYVDDRRTKFIFGFLSGDVLHFLIYLWFYNIFFLSQNLVLIFLLNLSRRVARAFTELQAEFVLRALVFEAQAILLRHVVVACLLLRIHAVPRA